MAEQNIQPTRPVHRIEIAHQVGELRIDAAFTLAQPWTVLFGPSGSGKTTILRAIAGLIRPAGGRIISIAMPGTPAECTVALQDKRRFVPAHRRMIRLAPQQANLFPHLTVRENLLYGVGGDSAADPQQIDRALRIFDLAGLAEKRSAQISGGEAQRVNLARAWLAAGQLLLLDEPFTGLDLAQQSRILSFLRKDAEQNRKTVLSVTHDIAEAFQLDAEVIKIANGRVVAQGHVSTVLAEERNRLMEHLTHQERNRA